MAFPASHTFVDEEQREGAADAQKQTNEEDVDDHHGSPLRFLPLRHVYSATSPCLSSKKIKARRPIFNVYSRRPKLCPDRPSPNKPSFFDSLLEKFNDGSKKRPAAAISVKSEPFDEGLGDTVAHDGDLRDKKRRRVGSSELSKLGIDSSTLCCSGPRLRESRNLQNVYKINSANSKREKSNSSVNCKNQDDLHLRKWVRLAFDGVDPMVLIGMQCKVYWPLDADWYKGSIVAFDRQSNTHNIKYEDGDEEDLILPHEKIKIHITREEMQKLNLHQNDRTMDDDDLDYGELVVLAASFDDCRELEPGDIIWAKLTGHAMWPAVIVDESHVGNRKGLRKCSGGKSLPVQFFGTHDFARIQVKQISSFLKGLLSSFHLKCRSPRFLRSLKEAKVYLNEQKLPKNMLHLQCESRASDHGCQSSDDERSVGSDTACIGDEGIQSVLNGLGDLQIISLGKVASDFQDEGNVWPVGYTAVRRFTSIRDPSASVFYKMEILRDPETKVRPMFKVTVDGEQFRGATPSACWNKIFNRMRRNEGGAEMIYESGSEMFGFNNPEVLKLIQVGHIVLIANSEEQIRNVCVKDLTSSKISNKISGYKPLSERYQTYRPVRIDWKDHDRCSVCHMDEEYENNLFLQCDKCRIMVHARCYGEEYVDGVLWLCNLCRSGAPESTPPCCLCPVIGGALKPTTDGRWAHLACAIWIPETCLSDIKRMEPIDGLNRINKDRWKLLCSICGVPYGACIQCSNNSCRVAYHPLCARAAGLCVELEDEDRLHLISFDEDEENQCIRLLSFCKKHRQPSNEHPKVDELIGQRFIQCADYIPPPNPSGCARTEPYDYLGRRGRKEPEAISAASVKRLFVENRPYLVGGYCLHESLTHESSDNDVLMGSKFFHYSQKQSLQNASAGILSMAEKFKHMRITFRKRLAFGKSRIHGFGIFAKQPHKAGDMVIEYTGEIVRPTVADRREHLIYNSLVGAGTYMFRIDNERVLDATRSGSIAHLINHSCEPNCYSRVITVNGEEHIIIFAKRDIRQWEELTYDYRFFSIDEQLACCCGFPRCRGVVNDVEAEEQAAKLYAPRSELIDWRGE